MLALEEYNKGLVGSYVSVECFLEDGETDWYKGKIKRYHPGTKWVGRLCCGRAL